MIITTERDKRFVKALAGAGEGLFGLHNLFGFISEQGAQDRLKSRRRRGIIYDSFRWDCLFSILHNKSKGKSKSTWTINAVENCKVLQMSENQWKLMTSFGNFLFSPDGGRGEACVPSLEIIEKDPERAGIKVAWIAGFLVIAFMLLTLFMPPPEEMRKEEEEEQVAVEVAPQSAVTIRMTPREKPTKEQIKKWRVHRAVQQNLGLLGLLGKKNLTKAVGGAPTDLKNVSPGAGQGGDQGSGGELLVGLGKGVRKTTVGNTGVKGLGGIGTKGRGGGQGGYGNTSIASGEGAGISTIAVSQDAVLDGGLDKYVIAATIQKYINQVRACYENELQKNPGLAGTVRIDFEIGGSGTLNYSKVKKSTLGNKKAETCITGKMMAWKFPRPRGGVKVPTSYPFILRPSGS